MKLKLKSHLNLLSKISLIVLLFWAGHAHAFPDLVRHGYASCSACHISPSGGGLTTAYGRSLSKELLSTWGAEGEEQFLYSVTPPEWLNVGGDVRAIQTYVDNTTATLKKFFVMQSDLEGAVSYKKFYVDGTVGTQGGPDGTADRNQYLSRRHYVGFRPTDETSIRVGRFMPAYGLNFANHTVVTRTNLGFDESRNTETDNVETSYSGEKLDLFITAILGRTHDYEADWRRGEAISTSYFLFDKFKIGLSYLHAFTSQTVTDDAGAYGVLGFSKYLYMLSEIDLQWQKDLTGFGTSPHGAVSYQQLNYEFIQGMHVYLAQQLSYLDYTDAGSRFDSWALGGQFFPRPHIDAEIEYGKARSSADTPYYDTAWLLLHYYL